MNKNQVTYEQAVKFHGHSCPGLATGYRVSQAALKYLFGERSRDEEMVAIVENDACGVDAVQVVTGCTFGKGNLVFRDYGKMAFTFFDRKSGRSVRLYLDSEQVYGDGEGRNAMLDLMNKVQRTPEEESRLQSIREALIDRILHDPEEKLIKKSHPRELIPERARIFKSRRCDACGEAVMATRIREVPGKTLCLPCYRGNNPE